MGIGVSIFLLAVGAILAFAVEADAEGINIETVGVILMVVGGLGVLFSLIFWSNIGSYGMRRRVVSRDVPAGYVVEERRDIP